MAASVKASETAAVESSARNAAIVSAAILLSRLAGLVRERVFAHYFGNSMAADAFKAALRIPNLLQNLFGEGVLSASFIPVYARLRAQGRDKDAAQVASVVASVLALVVSLLVALGIAATPWLIDLVAPGFEGQKRQATIELVRILFPGTGLLVASAWCLGVLNSHRKFFLSYIAPVLWNLAMIGALVWFGRAHRDYALAGWLAWGAVAGGLLQFGVQLPTVLRLVRDFRPSLQLASEHVREVLRNFAPVVLGRGVVQISAYIDSILASWLPTGAVAALAYAQILYTLPVSLFGMAVSAAELPEMSSLVGEPQQVNAALRKRMQAAITRMSFFIVPTSVAFLALGDVVAAVLFQTGRFTQQDSVWVWSILGGATVGLAAATRGRLYASAFYALGDTRTPLRFALLRLGLTASLGYLLALVLPVRLGIAPMWGAAGITIASGLAAWVEFLLLRRALHRRVGTIASPRRPMLQLWGAALLAAAAGWAARWLVGHAGPMHPILSGGLILAPFGACYLAATWLLGVQQARSTMSAVLRRLGARR